jgi:hypothetical protein
MKVLRTLGLGSTLMLAVQPGCGSGTTSSAGQTISGVVANLDGDPISGVVVSLGDDKVNTDSQGRYSLKTEEESGTVKFSKSGYLTGIERVQVEDFTVSLNAVLLKRAAKVTINAEDGGDVSGARGSRLTIPEGSIVDKDGNTVSGEVDVYLTPIDPSVPE